MDPLEYKGSPSMREYEKNIRVNDKRTEFLFNHFTPNKAIKSLSCREMLSMREHEKKQKHH